MCWEKFIFVSIITIYGAPFLNKSDKAPFFNFSYFLPNLWSLSIVVGCHCWQESRSSSMHWTVLKSTTSAMEVMFWIDDSNSSPKPLRTMRTNSLSIIISPTNIVIFVRYYSMNFEFLTTLRISYYNPITWALEFKVKCLAMISTSHATWCNEWLVEWLWLRLMW